MDLSSESNSYTVQPWYTGGGRGFATVGMSWPAKQLPLTKEGAQFAFGPPPCGTDCQRFSSL